ncbi:MAG: amidase, partial [Rhodospirillaceae bacterium]|nr:amidase [Rhodospirillaceae bacterium]
MNFEEYSSYDGLGLAALVREGEVTPGEPLEAAIGRIEEIDPGLNAVIHKTYERARTTVADGLPDGPFRGVPFLLKDLAVFCEGMPTAFGSRLFVDFVPDHDSTLVERQRAAGLVILGKTNTPEFGICAATESLLYGDCLNPWNRSRSPGGSSGGAAVAVATGMVPLAHATDAGGSIRIPAANCGLFGLKPTRGRTPQGPDLGEGLCGMSTGHCVSRSVRDSAALLDATHGPAPGDPYAAPATRTAFLDEVGA